VPRKDLGQHFLTDTRTLRRIVTFAALDPGDTVIEIGAGTGNLTVLLAERVRRVIAIEVDASLVPGLRSRVPENVEVMERDALDIDFETLTDMPSPVVANLPYNIATLLLERFVASRAQLPSVTVLVQKEVADRILAPPGTRVYGPLSVGIQFYAHVRGGLLVPPGSFKPQPRVYSRVVRLEWRPEVPEAPAFRTFVTRAFSSRRKKLVNNLLPMYPGRSRKALEDVLRLSDIDVGARPESLTPSQFFALWTSLEPDSGRDASS